MDALREFYIGNARRMGMAGEVLFVTIEGAGHILPYERPSHPPPSPTRLVASSAEDGRPERVSR
jgi:hypothetical protein